MLGEKITLISVQEFDELVRHTYKKPYSFQQQDGCKDRGLFKFTAPDEEWFDFPRDTNPMLVNGDEEGVSFKAWLMGDPTASVFQNDWGKSNEPVSTYRPHSIQLVWYRNFYPDVSMLINDLHDKGLIEAGEYGIDIDW